MSILVTGGCGYLGSQVIHELLKMDLNVVCIDNFVNSTRENLIKLSEKAPGRLTVIELDIRARSEIVRVFKGFSIKAVIHLAGLKLVSESFDVSEEYWAVNVLGTRCLLAAMHDCEIDTLIFSSSASVYAEQDRPVNENDRLEPKSPYASSKLAAEREIAAWVSACPNHRAAVVLRYFNPVGADIATGIGNRETDIQRLAFVPKLCRTVLEDGRMTVYRLRDCTEDPSGVRDFIHVRDLARAHCYFVNQAHLKQRLPPFDIFNIGRGEPSTVLELVKIFEAEFGMKVKFKIEQPETPQLCYSLAATAKMFQVCDWKPVYTIRNMVHDEFLWQAQLKDQAN